MARRTLGILAILLCRLDGSFGGLGRLREFLGLLELFRVSLKLFIFAHLRFVVRLLSEFYLFGHFWPFSLGSLDLLKLALAYRLNELQLLDREVILQVLDRLDVLLEHFTHVLATS